MRPTIRVLGLTSLAMAISFIAPAAQSQSISDLEQQAARFQSDAKELYRLDEANLQQIWEAYCGGFDPSIREDREFAADIARQLQYKESEAVDKLLKEDFPRLADTANRLMSSEDTKDRAAEILKQAQVDQTNLQNLYDGVILKGTNHPFVQYAIEYGKKQHKDMCSSYGEEPRVCDEDFPGADGRPDLVTVERGVLTVYEFKPDNSRARDRGQSQVERYAPAVKAYYEQFFPDGPEADTKGEPDSDHGSTGILQKLKNSKDAWDGNHLKVLALVKTYNMCDKRF